MNHVVKEKNKPWLSIITVCLNDSKNLSRTLQHLREQKFPLVQLIVIDGDSMDDTVSVIHTYQDIITDWVSEKDSGLYEAMNKGIDLALGEYLVFLNAGDIFHDSQVISKIHAVQGGEDILYGNAVFVDQEGRFKSERHKKIPAHLHWGSFRHGMVVCHQALIIRRAIAVYYNTKFKITADLDWAIRSSKQAKTVLNLDFIVCDFQRGGISDKKRLEALIERGVILIRYFGMWRTLWSHLIIPVTYLNWKISCFFRQYTYKETRLPLNETSETKRANTQHALNIHSTS